MSNFLVIYSVLLDKTLLTCELVTMTLDGKM